MVRLGQDWLRIHDYLNAQVCGIALYLPPPTIWSFFKVYHWPYT